MDKDIGSTRQQPKVSVVMSVYNGADYLNEAIDSILKQTFTDFEFIIINDGSTDKSLNIIKGYSDPRIVIVSRPRKGLVASLNEGLVLARGMYVARQDADDISVATRLEKEVTFLDVNPEVALVGSNYKHMDAQGHLTGTVTNVFTHPDDLKSALVTCNQYGHGSAMIRKNILEQTGMYENVGHVEDYDLWVRISQVAQVANISEPLYVWRKNEAGITLSNQELQIKQTFAIRDKAFKHYLKHRRQYRLWNYHPSGTHYRDRKAVLYRDFAYLFLKHKRWLSAIYMLVLATLIQPRNKRNYRYLLTTIYKPRSVQWEYEWI